MKKSVRRITGILLSLLLVAEMAVPSVAAEKGSEVKVPTISVSQEVLEGNYFYIANDTTSLSENDADTHIFTVGRGGSSDEEAEITVLLRDITALYGENYEAWVVGGEKATVPEGHYSYVSFFTDADYIEESDVISEEDAEEYLTELGDESETGSESEDSSVNSEEDGNNASIYSNTDNAIPPAELTLHFDAGESVKQVAVKPVYSSKSEGDASFMMALNSPSEGMEVSGLNSIMITIEDEGNTEPAELSFEQSAYYVAGDTAYVTVTRTGSLNDTVSAYLYTEEDSACGYYDFSPVGANLVFPFGVKSRTIEIPVNHLSDSERSFYVGLSSKAGCLVDESADRVKVTLAPCNDEDTCAQAQTDGEETAVSEEKSSKAEDDNEAEAQADSETTSKSDSVSGSKSEGEAEAAADSEEASVIKTMSFAASAKESTTAYATADSSSTTDKTLDYENKIDLSAVKIIGSGFYHGDGYVKLTTHDIDSDVVSAVRLEEDTDPAYHSYAYDGYEINWMLDEGFWFPDYYVFMRTMKSDGSKWLTSYRYDDDDQGFDDGRKTRIYKDASDVGNETEIGMVTTSGSGNDLYIYSITPIKRTFDVILQNADTKEFKNVSSVESDLYTGAELNNSTMTKKGVVYTQTMLGDTVTVTATDSNHYLRLAGLYIQDQDGNEITYIKNPSSSADSVSFDMDKDFLDAYGEYFEYEKNTSVSTTGTYDDEDYTSYSYTGKIYVKPDFRYRDVELNILEDDLGLGGFAEFTSTGIQQSWHMGDVVKLTGKIGSEYTAGAEVTGYAYKVKKNSQSETVSGTVDFGSSGSAEFRLEAESVSLRPISTEKSNALIVIVKDSDYDSFDHTKGIFAADSKYIYHDENAGEYEITVVPEGSLVNTQLCPVVAYTKDSSSSPVWTVYGDSKKYSGTSFYHEAGSRTIENIIRLGVEKSDVITTKLSGYLYYSNVNINTSRQAEGNFPAAGQSIGVSGVSAVSGSAGDFETESFAAARGTYVKYITGSNGNITTGSVYVNGSQLNAGVINVPVQSSNSASVKQVAVEQGGYYMVNTIPLSGVKTTFRASVNDNVDYYIGETKYTEHITDVNFIILDGTTLERKYEFNGQKGDDYEKDQTWVCEAGALTPENTSWYGPGDYLYVEIKTDRIKAEFEGADEEISEALAGSVYTPQYSGFTLVSTDSYESTEMEIGFPISADNLMTGDYKSFSSELGEKKKKSFVTLPLIGGLDTQLRAAKSTWKNNVDYKVDENGNENYQEYKDGATKSQSPAINFQVTVEERPNGVTRLKIGASVTFSNTTEENISQGRATKWSSVTGQFKGVFERREAEEKASESSTSKMIYNNPDKQKTTANSLQSQYGGTSMTLSFLVGIYLDFGLVEDVDDDSITGVDMKFLGLGAYFGMSGSIGYTQYFIVPVITIPGYIGFTGTAAVIGTIGATGSPDNALADQTDSFVVNDFMENPEVSLNGILSITGFLGVGIRGALGVRGTGTFTFSAGANSSYPDLYEGCDAWGVDLTFAVGAVIDIIVASIPLNIKSWDLWQAGYYDYLKQHNLEGLGGDETVIDEDSETDTDDVEYYYQERTGGSEFTGDDAVLQATYVSDGKASEKEVVDNVYTHPSAKMCDLGDGKILMVYLDDDSSKADNQITSLYYTVYNKGFWSTPVRIQADATGDFYPDLTDCGDKVLISWSSAPDTSGETDIDRVMAQEIYTAFYDKKSGSVGKISRLTDDVYFDSNPQAVYDEETDSIALYYTKNAPEMEKNSKGEWIVSPGLSFVEAVSQIAQMKYSMICYRLYENGNWTESYYKNEYSDGTADNAVNKGERYLTTEVTVTDSDGNKNTDPPIMDFTAAEGYNGLAVYAYTIDMDDDTETDSDRELFAQVYNFKTHRTYKPIRLTDNGVSESLPTFTRSDDTTRLFWLGDSDSLLYTNITDLVKYGINDDGTLKDTVKEAVSKVSTSEQKAAGDYDLCYHKVDLRHKDVSMEAESTLDDYTVVSDSEDNLYVIWTNSDYEAVEAESDGTIEMGREVYAAAMIDDGQGTAWSEPVKLTESGRVNDEISAVIDSNDNLVVASACFDMTYDSSVGEDENPIIQGPVDLMTTTLHKAGSVETTGIALSDTTPVAGDKVEVTVTVKNTGLTSAEGYSLDLYTDSASGTKIGSVKNDNTLLPGCASTNTFTWTVPEGFNGTRLCAVTKEAGYSNAFTYTSDAVKERAVYEVAVQGSRQDGDSFYLDVNVTNTGNKVSDASDVLDTRLVCLYGKSSEDFGLDSDALGQVKIGSNLGIGESRDYSIKLAASPKSFEEYGFIDVTVGVKTPDTDGSLVNLSSIEETFVNQNAPTDLTLELTSPSESSGETMVVQSQGDGSVTRDGTEVNEGVKLSSGASVNLTYSINGIPRGSGTVISSSDESVVQVKDGRLYAVSEGKAEITATVLPYGNSVSATVTVGGDVDGSGFTDVAAGSYYEEAVQWAVSEGITKGTSESLFSPAASCTRAQAVTFLWRAAGCPKADTSELKFKDVKAGSYYEEAVAWAVSEGITQGVSATAFDPDGVCTRGHIVTFLWRSAGSPGADGGTAGFTDVKKGAWYSEAVYWAYENRITTGISEALFAPSEKCTRAQIVTFLWRSRKA